MIYLMRHGQDDEKYIGGWSDVSLIPEGKKEIILSSLWLKENLNIKRIVSSDILRARETAKIASSILEIPIAFSKDLREQNKGILNGMELELAKRNYPDLVDVKIDTVYPMGESLNNLYQRIENYLEKILTLEDDTLIITHRGVINMIYYLLKNIPPDMDKKRFGVTTASIHELDQENKLIRKVR